MLKESILLDGTTIKKSDVRTKEQSIVVRVQSKLINTLDTLSRFSTTTWRYKYIWASTVIFLKGV